MGFGSIFSHSFLNFSVAARNCSLLVFKFLLYSFFWMIEPIAFIGLDNMSAKKANGIAAPAGGKYIAE